MYWYIVSLPSFSPISPKTVLTECVRASVSEIEAKFSPPKLASGTPLITLLFLPLICDCGVYLPESSAAAAVTTLNVEPGGYDACVGRLNSGELAALCSSACRGGTSFGSKAGVEAIPCTAPVRGSSATIEPWGAASWSSAAC